LERGKGVLFWGGRAAGGVGAVGLRAGWAGCDSFLF
jgi:hypothetical protein